MSDAARRQGRLSFDLDTLGPLDWLGAVLAAVTGVIHVYLFTTEGTFLFLLAGLGFFGAVLLLPATQGTYRLLLYGAGVLYVLVQILGYYTLQRPDGLEAMRTAAIVDKTAQVALVVLLIVLFVRRWRAAAAGRSPS